MRWVYVAWCILVRQKQEINIFASSEFYIITGKVDNNWINFNLFTFSLIVSSSTPSNSRTIFCCCWCNHSFFIEGICSVLFLSNFNINFHNSDSFFLKKKIFFQSNSSCTSGRIVLLKLKPNNASKFYCYFALQVCIMQQQQQQKIHLN